MTVGLLVGSVLALLAGLLLGDLGSLSAGFQAHWLRTFLALLALNLAGAVMNRLPLKRRQLSFVVVHASIISLLAGVWVSLDYSVTGRLELKVGRSSHEMGLRQHELVFRQRVGSGQGTNSHAHEWLTLPLPRRNKRKDLSLQVPEPFGFTVDVLESRQHAQIRTSIVPSAEGLGPGVEFRVQGPSGSVEHWLLANHPDHRRADLASLEVEILRFQGEEDFAFRARAASSVPQLIVPTPEGGDGIRIPLPEGIGQEYPLANGGTVVVQEYVEHARVADGQLLDLPDSPPNPAALVLVRRGADQERHLIFSQFPNFGVHQIHGGQPLTGTIRLQAQHASAKTLLSLLVDPEGRLHTQVTHPDGRLAASPLPQEDFTAVPGTPFSFELLRFVSRANYRTEVRNLPSAQDGTALVRLNLQRGERSSDFWLPLGDSIEVPLLGANRSVGYRRIPHALPFRLALESVEMPDPEDRDGQLVTHLLIASLQDGAMPQALELLPDRSSDFMGYRLNLLDVRRDEEGKAQSVLLGLTNDPGIPLIYGSFILLTFGVGWFVLSGSPVSRKRRIRRAKEEREVRRIEVVLSPVQEDPQQQEVQPSRNTRTTPHPAQEAVRE